MANGISLTCIVWTLSCFMWDLVPWPGIEPELPCMGSTESQPLDQQESPKPQILISNLWGVRTSVMDSSPMLLHSYSQSKLDFLPPFLLLLKLINTLWNFYSRIITSCIFYPHISWVSRNFRVSGRDWEKSVHSRWLVPQQALIIAQWSNCYSFLAQLTQTLEIHVWWKTYC